MNFTGMNLIQIGSAVAQLEKENADLHADLAAAREKIREMDALFTDNEMKLRFERDEARTQLAAAREALESLTGAVDPFLADQSGATSQHVGLVQPVSVAECCALNEAFKMALAALTHPTAE